MVKKKALIISGPTASGKTLLSEILQSEIDGEIINADLGQFYKPLSVGTAKPNLEIVKYKHHLFDIINTPQNLSVVKYRQLVSEKVQFLFSQHKTPIIVGGSLFYIKSLFFSPVQLKSSSNFTTDIDLDALSASGLRELLKKIDPVRAEEIHSNDVYRIRRALDIWKTTGLKPSSCKPNYLPLFDALIICVCPQTDILNQRIRQRVEQMFKFGGWIEEAKLLREQGWENFIIEKGLIGYSEIFEWLKHESKDINSLLNVIQTRTCQYAKRQRTFWQSFKKQLEVQSYDSKASIKILEINSVDGVTKKQILNAFCSMQ